MFKVGDRVRCTVDVFSRLNTTDIYTVAELLVDKSGLKRLRTHQIWYYYPVKVFSLVGKRRQKLKLP